MNKKKLLNKIEEQYEIIGMIDRQFMEQVGSIYGYNVKKLAISLPSIIPSNNINNIKIQGKNSYLQLQQLHPPTILILRQRHTQQLQIIQQFSSQKQILNINQQILKKIQNKIKGNIERQGILLRRITEKLFQESYNNMGLGYNYIGLNNNNRRNNDNNNNNNNNRLDNNQPQVQLSPQQIYLKNRRQSNLIKQQNKQYQEMQRKKLQSQQQKQHKKQQIQNYLQQRKCRKLSLPQQPIQQDNNIIIKIIFRCPNGDNISRKFKKQEKCEILYNWVQLNDQIEFQEDQEIDGNDKKGDGKQMKEMKSMEDIKCRKNSRERVIIRDRKFDLLYSYPPESLKDKVDITLGQIFEGQDQIKLLIREL